MLSESDLHNYQCRSADFIIDKRRCALWLDMGLGKTVSTLTAVSRLLDQFAVSRVIVIAPLRVANSVWRQETRSWGHLNHLRVSVCTGPEKDRLAALRVESDIYVINRENVEWLVRQYGKKWPFDCVVVDEASSFKNPSSKRFRALRKVLPLTNYMVLLTGTPSPNGYMDLWSQMYLIDQGEALGKTVGSYTARYFESDYMGYNLTLRRGAREEIHRLIGPRILSMQASDYIRLPDRIELIEKVPLPPKAMADYLEFEKSLLLELPDGEEIEAISAGVLANKLMQFANGAMYTDKAQTWSEIHKAKLDTLADILEQNEGENILLAYTYQSDLDRICKRFPFARVLDKNPATVTEWNAGKIRLLVAHPASCGHGLNLQHGGSMIVWFGATWSLELHQQLNARLHRQGQSKPVRIIYLAAEGTIDERVIAVLKDKNAAQSSLLMALRPPRTSPVE